MPRSGLRVLFVVPSGDYLPSGIVRVAQFVPFLERNGIAHRTLSYYSPQLDRLAAVVRGGELVAILKSVSLILIALGQVAFKWWARILMLWFAPRVDVVFLQGILPPVWHVRALRALNPYVVLDMDDAIFLGNPQRGAAVVSRMTQVIAGSHFIHDYASTHNDRVALVPSAVSLGRYGTRESASCGTRVRIGWLGSTSTIKYLSHLIEPLTALAAEGHDIELHIDGIGNHEAALPKFPGVTVTSSPNYRDEDIPGIVAGYDVGVMPLDDGPWEQAKCAMKALIYMAAGKPAVCSRVGENAYVIDDGVNGLLAGSAAEWTMKLRSVIADPGLRADLGRRGRKTVEDRYSTVVCFALLQQHVFARAELQTVSPGMTS